MFLSKLASWWLGPYLSGQYTQLSLEEKRLSFLKLVGLSLLRFLVHPLKRRLAKCYLVVLKLLGLKVIAITGSSGKTTAKEMLLSILSLKGACKASFANIDPVYNIPTTILTTHPWCKYLILEMGVEHPGEMAFYLCLVKPDLALITNIYPTHTEFFRSIEGVFKEKSQLALELPSKALIALNREDKYLLKLMGKTQAEVVWFGQGSQVFSEDEELLSSGQTSFKLVLDNRGVAVKLPILGKQFINSALAVSALAYKMGLSKAKIKEGLETFRPLGHRMEIIKHPSGAIILDDSYNNNPEAFKKALRTFAEFAEGRPKIIVFGDMLELGGLEKNSHIEAGRLIADLKPLLVVCVGQASKVTAETLAKTLNKKQVILVNNWQEALTSVKSQLKRGVYLLVKGSRSIGLDQLVAKL